MPDGENFSITNKTKGNPLTSGLPFENMKNFALGTDYSLSLVFIGDGLSRKLNKERRGKDKPANILSFPLSENEGEIFINLSKAKKEAPEFGRDFQNFIGFLFIHGLVHLKGFDHGEKMESEEIALRKKFDI